MRTLAWIVTIVLAGITLGLSVYSWDHGQMTTFLGAIFPGAGMSFISLLILLATED